MIKKYYDADCNLGMLDGKTVSIIGFGSQGHAHAQNLHESGVNVVVGLRKGSESWAKAEAAGLTVMEPADAAKAGDKVALEVLDEYYDYMGQFLGSLCSAVDPEVVVLGGGVSKAGDVLLTGVEPYFHKYVFHAASEVKFALASLGNDAGAYGAFKLALDAFN